jgi:hypothetical protein
MPKFADGDGAGPSDGLAPPSYAELGFKEDLGGINNLFNY